LARPEKLSEIDSLVAKNIFTGSIEDLVNLKLGLKNKLFPNLLSRKDKVKNKITANYE